MNGTKNLKGVGAAWLCIGVAFLGVAASGQLAFLGAGAAFLGLGVAFLAKSRRDG